MPGDGRIVQAFYSWKRRFAGMGLSEVRELRQLREENRKLKAMLATATELLSKSKALLAKAYRPTVRKKTATPRKG